jgi:hypothetical protein
MKREQQFFDDKVVDRLMGVVMALAAEVYILKDRERALEQLLVSKGVIGSDAVEAFQPGSSGQAISGRERDEFVGRIFESIVEGGEAMSAVDLDLVSDLTTRSQA